MSTLPQLPDAAATWDGIYSGGRAARYWPSEDVVRFCARRLQPCETSKPFPPTVLEAGCGNGANLWFLQHQGFYVLGVDASTQALYDAKRLLFQRCGVREGDVLERVELHRGDIRWCAGLPGNPALVDAIIDCRASQHLRWSEHASCYRGYYDTLKPGGWLFLLHLDNRTYPDASQDKGKLTAVLDHDGVCAEQHTWSNVAEGVYANNGVVCMPPPPALGQLLASRGFSVERAETLTRNTTDAPDNSLQTAAHTAIDARKPL